MAENFIKHIKKISFKKIYSSRGFPTTKCTFTTDLGIFEASCPSGASTGENEAKVLTDKDLRTSTDAKMNEIERKYSDKNVDQAIFDIDL